MNDGLRARLPNGTIVGFEPVEPIKPVLVLRNGIRVPLELKFVRRDDQGRFIFRPVIEGDIAKLMPLVVSIDAEMWPRSAAVIFPSMDSEWCQRLIDSSPILAGLETRGKRWEREK